MPSVLQGASEQGCKATTRLKLMPRTVNGTGHTGPVPLTVRGNSCPPDVLVVRFIEMRAFAVAGPGGGSESGWVPQRAARRVI